VVAGALPDLGAPFGGAFDGILRSAVLMHFEDADRFDAVLALRSILQAHGRLLVSLPTNRTDVGLNERGANARLFRRYGPDEIQLLLERLGAHHLLLATSTSSSSAVRTSQTSDREWTASLCATPTTWLVTFPNWARFASSE